MCGAVEHRGPDSRGIHRCENAGLGIQRLRVIDLETGDQPIYNEDRSIVVVLNGEVYNFRALRSRLEKAGHVFNTAGDTEVIVHLYEEEGPDCVRSLQGMFAFALWDKPRRRLLLARDRVGKKPLFYSVRDGMLGFASELQALIRDPSIPRQLDPEALDYFLAYGYIPAPHCAFRGVRKLEPATRLTFSEDGCQLDRYWRLDYSKKRRVADLPELYDEIRHVIRKATTRRMIADVPLGAFLSGGIDSSAVVASMSEAASAPVKTFAIGFEAQSFNELPYAARIAELFGTDHHEFVVTPNAIELAPTIVRHYGEPFADSSAIPSFYLAEVTRHHVTVALNGDGGDESFGGYQRYVANQLVHRLSRLPRPVRLGVVAAARRLPASGRMDSATSRARRLSRSLVMSPGAAYARHMAFFTEEQRAGLYATDFQDSLGGSTASSVITECWNRATSDDPIDKMLEVDVSTYLPGDLLVKMDIATMAYGLEARSPFLDSELMEFAASIPSSLKVRGLQKKVVLRDALRGWIPDEILDRRKRGFEVPLAAWLRGGLRDWARDIILDPKSLGRGYFEEKSVRRMLDRHDAQMEDASPRIWALVMLELWQQEVVEREDPRDREPVISLR